VIAALRPEGLTAPAVFDGPIDNASFLAYIERVVVPSLRPGDVVVLDKPRCTQTAGGPCGHHTRPRASELPAALQSGFQSDRTRVREIESVLRAIRPRSFDHVTELVAVALALFTPTECQNYVRHCGYRLAVQL